MALRSLYESFPALHVVAAGSLLEFALGEASFPVGRVEHLWLHPMVFWSSSWRSATRPPPTLCGAALMPFPRRRTRSCSRVSATTSSSAACPRPSRRSQVSGRLMDALHVHDLLVTSYRDDFAKYRPRVRPDTLDEVLTLIARDRGFTVEVHQAGARRDGADGEGRGRGARESPARHQSRCRQPLRCASRCTDQSALQGDRRGCRLDAAPRGSARGGRVREAGSHGVAQRRRCRAVRRAGTQGRRSGR